MQVAVLTKLIALVVVCAVLGGCAGFKDRRDSAWDPRAGSGQTLLDQIPNFEGEAERRCCGHKRSCGVDESPRC